MVKSIVEDTKEDRYLSVGDLASCLNSALERQFPEVCFRGEVSQVILARSGHLYLTIKDETGQLPAVMWAGLVARLDFEVEQGMSVLCHGKPNVYRASGKLQIILHRILPAGEGLLRKRFIELQAKLEKEGLFSPDRKRRLPFLPKAIGLVTSRAGAAVHDILVRLRERMPQIPVYLVDVKVQGEGAAEEIAQGIRQLDQSGLVDVIIVGRGGGSLEDLWAFNEEVVVRAIFASQTPIVSGVGHEVDFSLADYVADLRAPTPTAAAEMVVPRRSDLLERIAEFERRLNDTDRWIQPLNQEVDELTFRLDACVGNMMQQAQLRLDSAMNAIKTIEPKNLLKQLFSHIELNEQKLSNAFLSSLQRSRHQLDRFHVRLEALSPKKVMERGFSIVELNGKIMNSSQEIKIHDSLKVSLFDGVVRAVVKEKF